MFTTAGTLPAFVNRMLSISAVYNRLVDMIFHCASVTGDLAAAKIVFTISLNVSVVLEAGIDLRSNI